MKKWIILGVIAVVLLMLVSSLVGMYNGLVSLDQGVQQSWAQVETQLQRRYDLIPNLVSTVKGYAKHEKDVFVQVTEARAKVGSARTVNDKVVASNAMESAIARLLLVAENYPQLKASTNFLALQDELAGTENRISVARMRYNEVVQTYNTTAKSLPTVLFVGMFGFDKDKAFFKTSSEAAKAAPAVNF